MKKKVLAAMSGGVDSSVAALLLQQQGYEVIGMTMRLFDPQALGLLPGAGGNGATDAKDAHLVAEKLGIEHYVVDLSSCFKRSVIDRFVKEYELGRTPNPCVYCNKHIKFGALFEQARQLGCDYLATGHYARVEHSNATARWLLRRSTDETKDQSYMLFNLTQELLPHTLLPLAELCKTEIRGIAAQHGFVTAQKPESQDICFVPDGDYTRLINHFSQHPLKPGSFKHINGELLGTHKGLEHYTIGQRKGLGIAYEYPLYVIDKDLDSNVVLLGPNDALFQKALLADNCNWILFDSLVESIEVTVKTRYRQKDVPAVLEPVGKNSVKVVFSEPQRAITPGQAVVFYKGDYVVGGGIIRCALNQ